MENKDILEQIKANGSQQFKAINIGDNTTHRCYIESDGNIFVYARNKKRYGWRFDEDRFLIRFTPLLPTDENEQWKRRLKRAVKLCHESGLWSEIAVVWNNLYKYYRLAAVFGHFGAVTGIRTRDALTKVVVRHVP